MDEDARQSLNRTFTICPRGKKSLDSSTSVSLPFCKIRGISKYCSFFRIWHKIHRRTSFIAYKSQYGESRLRLWSCLCDKYLKDFLGVSTVVMMKTKMG